MNVMLTSDDVSAYTAYQNGDLDFIDSIPTAEIEAAKKTSEFYTVDNLGTYYVGFNINSKLYSELGLDADQAKGIQKSNLSSYRSSVHYRYNRGATEDRHNIYPRGRYRW